MAVIDREHTQISYQQKPKAADHVGGEGAGLPKLRMPTPEIADRGTVRLGCGIITGDFPVYP